MHLDISSLTHTHSLSCRVDFTLRLSPSSPIVSSPRFASIALQEVEQHYKRLRSKVIKQKDETAVKLWQHAKSGGGLNSYFKGRNSNAASVVEIEKGGKKEPKSGMGFPGTVLLFLLLLIFKRPADALRSCQAGLIVSRL